MFGVLASLGLWFRGLCFRDIPVSMAAVYQLKIKYDQEKFGVVPWQTKRVVTFPLEDKHVLNEHHVIRKSHDAILKNVLKWCIQCTT